MKVNPKSIISCILILSGIVIKNTYPQYFHVGWGLIIGGSLGLIVIFANMLYLANKEIKNPKKMPPPKNKKGDDK